MTDAGWSDSCSPPEAPAGLGRLGERVRRFAVPLLRLVPALFAVVLLLMPSLRTAKPALAGPALVLVVNTTSDAPGSCPLGGGGTTCSLREAITTANAGTYGSAPYWIKISVGSGPVTLPIGSAVPAVTQSGTWIDGTTQPTYPGTPYVRLNNTGPSVPGLTLSASSITVQGFSITGFSDGIQASGGLATIQGNFIGSDMAGAAAANTGDGILVTSGGNTIGMPPGSGCSIGCNLINHNFDGIHISGAAATSNLVQHNGIGGAPSSNLNDGVLIDGGATGNIIGLGPAFAVTGNVISGNANNGIEIDGAGTNGNMVQNNAIGTDGSGTTAIPNGNGVHVWVGAANNLIGYGGVGNVISGNAGLGVWIANPGTSGNIVASNLIGTNVSGTGAIPNVQGISIDNAGSNTISGDVVSGNSAYGIGIVNAGAAGNIVKGSLIGTDVSGTAAVPNGQSGIIIEGGTNNTIGGTAPADRNIISGNSINGVFSDVAGTTGNVVEGNYVGLDVTGTVALPNAGFGVEILQGSNNTIGGSALGSGNTISGNTNGGVIDYSGSGNVVQGNYIGTNASASAAVTNAFGVDVGGTGDSILDNVISGNNAYGGLFVAGTGTLVRGNLIGTDAAGAVAVPNSPEGVLFGSGGTNNTIASNVIANNSGSGVVVDGSTPPVNGNRITRNSIYANASSGISLVAGGNHNLAPPVITSSSATGPTTGTTSCLNCIIEVFSDDGTQGGTYQGTTMASGGVWSLTGPVAGPNVTATVSDPANSYETSPFSAPFTLPAASGLTYNSQVRAQMPNNAASAASDLVVHIGVPASGVSTDEVSVLMNGSTWNALPAGTVVGNANVNVDLCGYGTLTLAGAAGPSDPIPLRSATIAEAMGSLPSPFTVGQILAVFKADAADVHKWQGATLRDDLGFDGSGYGFVLDMGGGISKVVFASPGSSSLPACVRVTDVSLRIFGTTTAGPLRTNPVTPGYYPVVIAGQSARNPLAPGMQRAITQDCFYVGGTAPANSDVDGDCLESSATAAGGRPTESPGNDLNADLDHDGLLDGSELVCGSSITVADTDGDGMGDLQECLVDPSPTSGDTDGDNVSDLVDNCPNVANSTQTDVDHDGLGDACDTDRDGDGITDEQEVTSTMTLVATAGHQTWRCDYGGSPHPGVGLDPLKRDTDGDGVLDGAECALGSNPLDPASKPEICGDSIDNDLDGLIDEQPSNLGRDFTAGACSDPDADGLMGAGTGGISFENIAQTCLRVRGPQEAQPPADPVNCIDANYQNDGGSADADADGVSDGVEFMQLGTSPTDPDSDGDGCKDGQEVGVSPTLGGDRDPLSNWDFFDVPTPALTTGSPNGTRNKSVTLSDVAAVLYYVGTTANSPYTTNPHGVRYGSDLNSNYGPDGREYDRTPSANSLKPWRSGQPNGAVTLQDVSVALAQVGGHC